MHALGGRVHELRVVLDLIFDPHRLGPGPGMSLLAAAAGREQRQREQGEQRALHLGEGKLRPMSEGRKIRVVVAKPGLDGHDRGAKIIARALRDAGMEVIYTGLHQTPEQIVETAIQEDADAVGISILSGAHMTLVPRILEGLRAADADDVLVIVGGTIPTDDADELKEQGADDVIVVVGGTIPNDDIPELKELGVAEIFTPGSSVQGIVDYIQESVAA